MLLDILRDFVLLFVRLEANLCDFALVWVVLLETHDKDDDVTTYNCEILMKFVRVSRRAMLMAS